MKGAPLSIALLTTFAGLVLVYWSLVGFGLISGNTPGERAQNLKAKVNG